MELSVSKGGVIGVIGARSTAGPLPRSDGTVKWLVRRMSSGLGQASSGVVGASGAKSTKVAWDTTRGGTCIRRCMR